MRVYDIIKKKRDGLPLSAEEIRFFVNGYTNGTVPDYQASALMMAIYFKGMNHDETAVLTEAMASSGDKADLSAIKGPIVDKHSTGGVGDKTSLIVAPIVASCGVKIAKMSGAGLGHTGGTTDKLLSIPSLKIDFSKDEFTSIVNNCGACICSSTAALAPADKKLYSLRDVTATVDSIPLIAASIMSKKIASGSKNIVLDVKAGSGAFMKKSADAKALAKEMVSIGDKNGLRVTALITNMDAPLGYAIGNSLEVIEAVQTLKGIGPSDLTDLCLRLSAELLYLAGKGTAEECFDMAKNALYSGLALERFIWMISSQGGDTSVITDTSLFRKSKYFRTLKTRSSGYIQRINAEQCGIAAMLLGAGRKTKEDSIEYSAGIILDVKPGSFIKSGDRIATLYAEDESLFDSAVSMLSDAFDIGEDCPQEIPMVIDRFSNT